MKLDAQLLDTLRDVVRARHQTGDLHAATAMRVEDHIYRVRTSPDGRSAPFLLVAAGVASLRDNDGCGVGEIIDALAVMP